MLAAETTQITGLQTEKKKKKTLPNAVPLPTPKQAKITTPEALHERVEHVSVENETSDKSSVYDSAELAKVGALIECPQCGVAFTKANKWHTFCKSGCKDSWHNERNPERLAHAKRKRAEG